MVTSFAEAYPEIAKTWSDRNLPLTPDQVSHGSTKKAWWKGECGHEWEAIIKNRGHGHGCPYCSGNKVLAGYNDLETCFPDVAADWSDKNYPLKPDMVTTRGPRRVWWKCHVCGYEWQARVADRTAGSQCPCCADMVIVPGINDLASKYPDLASEWSDKNDKRAEQMSPRADYRAWWKCGTCGNEWQVKIHRRIIGAGQCPICVGTSRQASINDKRCRMAFKHVRLRVLVLYQLEFMNETVIEDDSDMIGMSLMFYLPKRRIAIEVIDGNYDKIVVKEEKMKESLCGKSKIMLIRILASDAPDFDFACIRAGAKTWKSECNAVEGILHLLQILPQSVSMDRSEEAVYQYFLKRLTNKVN